MCGLFYNVKKKRAIFDNSYFVCPFLVKQEARASCLLSVYQNKSFCTRSTELNFPRSCYSPLVSGMYRTVIMLDINDQTSKLDCEL